MGEMPLLNEMKNHTHARVQSYEYGESEKASKSLPEYRQNKSDENTITS